MSKVWLAIFFGYQGTNYYGMQYQKQQNIKAIENQLVRMLKERDLIATNNHTQLSKNYRWSRAARTDRGVHALINGISLLFTIPQQFFGQDQILNKDKLTLELKDLFLDSDFIFHGVKRVTPRFQMRQLIKSRSYVYICPKNLFETQKKLSQEVTLERINKLCEIFIGTHNFHNYSRKIKATDSEAKRYIIRFQCSSLNQKMYKFQIQGQSFIYHQIRKMIGTIVLIILNDYSDDFLKNTFFRNQLHLPLAPAHGLYLQNISFESYNKKKDIPEPIQFHPEEQSIQILRQRLHNVIMNIEENIWKEFYQKIKQQSFINNASYVDDQEHEAIDDN